MKKVLILLTMIFGAQMLQAQQYRPIEAYVYHPAGIGVSVTNYRLWIRIHRNSGDLFISGLTDSTGYRDSILTSLAFDSISIFGYDCNGQALYGLVGPFSPSFPYILADTIFPACPLPISTCPIGFTAQPTPQDSLEINFTDTSSSTGVLNVRHLYFYDFGDGDSSHFMANVTHRYAKPGKYFVQFGRTEIDTVNGNVVCSNLIGDTVYVGKGTPSTSCQASYVVDTLNSGNGTAFIYNNSTPAPSNSSFNTSYHWDFGDGDSSNAPFPVHNYAASGSYAVCLSVIADSSGVLCTSTFCDTLGIDSLGNLLYKNSTAGFTLKVLDPAMGIVSEGISQLEIYPNPVRDFIMIKGHALSGEELTYSLYDLKGAVVKSGRCDTSREFSINVSALLPGVYLLNLESGKGEDGHYRVVKE